MNLFMAAMHDGWRRCGYGCGSERARDAGGLNAKLAIHTKSPGFQVKRGEYITASGINPFELALQWNNWRMQCNNFFI